MGRLKKPGYARKPPPRTVAITLECLIMLKRMCRYYGIRKNLYVSGRQMLDTLITKAFKKHEDSIIKLEQMLAEDETRD